MIMARRRTMIMIRAADQAQLTRCRHLNRPGIAGTAAARLTEIYTAMTEATAGRRSRRSR